MTTTLAQLTVSQLEAFDRCPMEYHLKYRLGVPARNLPGDPTEIAANRQGDLVHAILQQHYMHPQRALADIQTQVAQERGLTLTAELRDTIDQLCAPVLAEHWEERCSEIPFVLKLGSALIHGTIDFMGKTADGWEIVDYKTDFLPTRNEVTARATHYELQMTAYAIAAQQASFIPLLQTTLHFLRINEKITVSVTDERLQTGQLHMQKIVAAIATNQTTITTAPPCRNCPFHRNSTCGADRFKGG